MINNIMLGVLHYRIDNYNYQCNNYVDAYNCDNYNRFNYYYWCDKLIIF